MSIHSSIIIILIILFLLHAYFQIAATHLIVRDDETLSRKVALCCLVWLVPVLGVSIVGYLQAVEYEGNLDNMPKFSMPLLWLASHQSSGLGSESGSTDMSDSFSDNGGDGID